VKLHAHHLDRAAGVLVGQACGDALGVPYEFALQPEGEPQMVGGGLGPYAPGEYSDDTQMAVCIAEVAATGADLRSADALDRIAERFLAWKAGGASDVGIQTAHVLRAARSGEGSPSSRMRQAAQQLHEKTGRTAGNGALMRTGIVGLASLGDLEHTAAAARAVAELTHADPLAGDSCVLWSIGVAVAVAEGTFDGVRMGLDYLPSERRSRWAGWLDEAEGTDPKRFSKNGFTVTALQAA
jgi:ADP-ribosylglycohydrolase